MSSRSKITLVQHKQTIVAPHRLNNYDVNISGDHYGRLRKQVYSVDLDLKRFDVRQVKLGNRMYPYFTGKKEDAIQFKISFTESFDSYVEKFFQDYEDKLYDESGLIKMKYMNDVLMDVKVYQLDHAGERIVTYYFSKCLFIEETSWSYAHDSQDIKILSYTVYARRFRKFFGGDVGYENMRTAQVGTSVMNTDINKIENGKGFYPGAVPKPNAQDSVRKRWKGNIPYIGKYIED